MDSGQFRTAVGALGVGLADFGEMVGVSSRTVSRWATEDGDGIPGPVVAYLDLLLRLTPQDRAIEIGRALSRGHGMNDGMYVMNFEGVAGVGDGQLVFNRGKVTGYDSGGGQYDGSYTLSADRRVAIIKVRCSFAPDSELVTGAVLPHGMIFDIEVNAPAFAKDHTTLVNTPFGQVKLRLMYRRAFAA